MLTSMLDNWDEVEKAQNIAADSAGVASSRYEIYMQSIEAATNKFKTALQDVYMEEGFEKLITDVINLGTEVLVLAKNLSVLKPILDSIALAIQVIEDTGILSTLSSLNESLGGSEFRLGDILGGASGALLEITNAIKSFEGNGNSIIDLTPLEDLDELVDSLERLYKSSEYIKHLVDQLKNFYKSLESVNNLFENGERTYPEWQGALKDTSDAVKETSESVSEAEQKLQDFSEAMDVVSDAMKEQSANGNLSFETMQKLIAADSNIIKYLYQEAGGWKLNTQAMIADTTAALNKILSEQGLTNVLAMVAKGEYETAYATLASKTARGESITDAMKYIAMLKSMTSAMTTSVGGASSAIKSLNDIKKEGYEAEIDAIEKQKDALDGQKKRLEDQKKAYKDIIDAMKEKLRLAKEEDDYQSELEEKNKEIVDIDNQLLAMQFDNSEEANKKRLELEEERAKKSTELEQFQADRTYEIQIDALDKEYAAFEAMIDKQIAGIDRMISRFDAMIDKINEMIEALDKLGSAGSGVGGGVSTKITTTTSGTDRQGGGACFVAGTKVTLSDGKVKNIEDFVVGDFVLSYDLDEDAMVSAEIVETFVHDVNEVYEINDNIQVTGEHRLYVNNEWMSVRDMNIGDMMYDKSGNYAVVYGITKINKTCKVYNLHTNHISHNYFANNILAHNIKTRYDIYHDGGIVGGIPKLKAGEEFAKLLTGEVVANDAQMKNFMNTTLPNLVANVGGGGNSQNNIEMNFNFPGNLDKSVIPDIKNAVASVLNDMQRQKGKKTNVSSYSI